MSHPRKVNFPGSTYEKWMAAAEELGYTKRSERWDYLELMIDQSLAAAPLYRKRP